MYMVSVLTNIIWQVLRHDLPNKESVPNVFLTFSQHLIGIVKGSKANGILRVNDV